MRRSTLLFGIVSAVVLGQLALWQVNRASIVARAEESEECDANPAWLASGFAASHAAIPDERPDCDFYQASWQFFLEATAGADGKPAFLAYPTISDLFGTKATPLFPSERQGVESAALRVAKLPNEIDSSGKGVFGSGIRQAGDVQGILTDRFGNPLYYSIHVNPAYQKFIHDNGLVTPDALRNAPPELAFSDGTASSYGVAEFKAAWQIVDDANPPKGFFLTKASVPIVKKDGDALSLDPSQPRSVTLALVAFHVAFALDNHPELVWATFEHHGAKQDAEKNFLTDLAPSSSTLPPAAPAIVGADQEYILWAANSAAGSANTPADPKNFDAGAQRFTVPTPVYRVFPAAKTTEASRDEAVLSLNRNMATLLPTNDLRGNYDLVGAVWLKHSVGPQGSFAVGKRFFNKDGQSSDEPDAMLSGEAALSSTAMESFTQQPDSFVNCFACHDTQKVKSDIDPNNIIVQAKKLNVSHVISRFLSESGQ